MPREFVLYLAVITIRSLGLMAAAGILTLFARNVAIRHAIWAVTVGSIMLLPAAAALVPAVFVPEAIQQAVFQPSLPVRLPLPPTLTAGTLETTAASNVSVRAGYDVWQWTFAIYAAVALLLLLRTGIAHLRVRGLTRASAQIKTPAFDDMVQALQLGRRAPLLLESGKVRVPLTVGFLKPVVLLPRSWVSWKDWDLRAVLAHELTHVRRADWAITAVAGLNRCVFWFNPFSWWTERHLCALAEQASDEASLSLIGDAPRYAEVLLSFAAEAQDGRRLAGGMAMARRNIRTRIDRILTLQHPQSGVLKRAGWIALVVGALPVIYLAAAVQNAPARVPPSKPAQIEPATRPPQRSQSEAAPRPDLRTTRPAVEPSVAEPQNLLDDAFSRAIQDAVQESEIAKAQYNDLLSRWRNGVIQLDSGGQVQNLIKGWYADQALYQMPADITLPPDSYAFFLAGAADGSVSFRRAEGTTWNVVSYGCQDCSFFVNETGVGPENSGGKGILLKMDDKKNTAGEPAGELTVSCRARECWASQVAAWGPSPASARFKFDVAKFGIPVSDFSQVLIIVSR